MYSVKIDTNVEDIVMETQLLKLHCTKWICTLESSMPIQE